MMGNLRFFNIENMKSAFDEVKGRLNAEDVINRIWERDYTVWKDDPDEISNRLNWLDCPLNMKENISGVMDFVDEIKSGDFSDILLMGMGGSSLTPEFFGSAMVEENSVIRFQVADSTHPAAIGEISESLDPLRMLFITSTKSGGGFFIRLMENYQPDLPIPDGFRSSNGEITFGNLIRAQCLGDRDALIKGGRKVLTMAFNSNTIKGLADLIDTAGDI